MPHRTAPTHYCDTYGFDADWRRARLDLLELRAEDVALGEQLRERIIRPQVEAIVDAFYDRLSADGEARQILAEADFSKLKISLADYLLNFGADFTQQDYFEEHLRIGLVHAWVGVPLGLYICAYQILRAQIQTAIEQREPDARARRALCAFVYKIGALDTSLAAEIYHIAQMRHLESSVLRLRDFDLIARYGGEEFIAVLQDTPLDVAEQIAERVHRRVGDHLYNVVEGGLRITLSQGVAQAYAGDSVESLIARADAALYAAKQSGRDRVMLAEETD